jgi:hypothetical protein
VCILLSPFYKTLYIHRYAWLPAIRKRGGWPLVLKFYAAMQAASAALLFAFKRLEALDPLLVSPFDPEARAEAARAGREGRMRDKRDA